MKMFAMKSKILQASLGLAAALPLATAGAFSFANSAEAATFSGGFNFGPAGLPPSTLQISNSSIAFDPTPGLLSLSLQSGDFKAFDAAKIFDTITNPLTVGSTLLDLGQAANFLTLSDSKNTFKLASFGSIFLEDTVDGLTNGRLGFTGFFDDGLGNQTEGRGTISFVVQDTKDNVQNALIGGQAVKASFTGAALATVPEPATLLGLGLTGAAMFASRRRKGQVIG